MRDKFEDELLEALVRMLKFHLRPITLSFDLVLFEMLAKANANLEQSKAALESLRSSAAARQVQLLEVLNASPATSTPVAKQRPELKVFITLRAISYCLPRRLRERVFEPAFADMRLDYHDAVRGRTSRRSRFIKFGLAIQAVILVAGCFRALVLDYLTWMMPKSMRDWWTAGPK